MRWHKREIATANLVRVGQACRFSYMLGKSPKTGSVGQHERVFYNSLTESYAKPTNESKQSLGNEI